MIKMSKWNIKMGNGHAFVYRGVHVRVFNLINGCRSNANFAWKSMMFIGIEVFFFIIIIMLLQLCFFIPTSSALWIFKNFLQ